MTDREKGHIKTSFRLVLLLAVLLGTRRGAAQSSFESDPFASRFRERSTFDIQFRAPEKGGAVKVVVPPFEGGRQTLVSENVWEAEAPAGERITLEYQDIRLMARWVRVDYERRLVVAEGDVLFEQGKSRMTGARLDLDLATKTGVMTDGAVDLDGGIHIRGELLAKVGPRSFTMSGATLTACDGDHPAWEFGFSRGRVTVEEYARLSNVVFRMGGVPLLYSPYILWPAMRARASGFLIPAIGYNSQRGGFLGLAYFLTLGRSADATFSSETYTNGTFGLGMELRARPSKGTTFEGTYFTVNDQDLGGWGWKTRGKIVSDDLAPGLRGVVSWLDFSSLDFFQSYERDFALSATRSIKSEAFLTYGADPVSLNLRLDQEKTLFGSSEVVTERAPVVEARLRPTPLLGQSLFVEATAQAGQLHLDRGPGQPSGTYGRFDLFPKVSAPLSPIPWLSIQANAGGRITWWGSSIASDPSTLAQTLTDASYVRKLGTVGIELTGPSFARIFEAKVGPYTKFKHVLEPRFDYDYMTSPDDLARAPLFDEIDTVSPAHTLRYALVQRLLAKGKEGGSREIASFEISRIHYFHLPPLGSSGYLPDADQNSPVDATLRVNATSALNLDARTTWDLKRSVVTSASLSANLNLKDRSLSVSYFESRPATCIPSPDVPCTSAQVRISGGLPILPKRLRLDLQANYDVSLSKLQELRTLLTIEASCFKVLLEYRDLRLYGTPSRDFRVGLNLKNIGSFLDFPVSLP